MMMEPVWSRSGSSSESNFGFAFNDRIFSDRILRIEVMAGVDAPPNSDGVTTTVADGTRPCKRNRQNALNLTALPDEHIPSGNQPDMDEAFPGENPDEEETVEESPCTIVRVKTLHISSAILASKSPFFFKLFSEQQTHVVTLRINESEEAAFMKLLNFMYSNTLNSVSEAPDLLNVLMVAHKFEVSSCLRYCTRLPMTLDFALIYLELPHTVLMSDAVQPLIDAAKQYLACRYKDITKFKEEVMALPLSGIEAILASDDLHVESEDVVFDFVLKWATQHYNSPQERQEVLGTRLARLIRFPYMTCQKLKKVLTCNDFKHKVISKLVLEALFFKAMPLHRQRSMAAEESASLNHRLFVERAYYCRPVKVVELEFTQQQCVVYLDLKREECANLFPSGKVYSQTFHLGGHGFFLLAQCNMDRQGSCRCFGLFLGMQKSNSLVSFSMKYEFAARTRPTDEFVIKDKCGNSLTFTPEAKFYGRKNLFNIPWTSFMAEDSIFFINGVLHLRAQLTIIH